MSNDVWRIMFIKSSACWKESKQVLWELVQLLSLHESEVISTVRWVFKKEPNVKYFIVFSSKGNLG